MPDILCLGEPMLEYNQQPTGPDGRTLYLEGHGGDVSNAAIAAARSGADPGVLVQELRTAIAHHRFWERDALRSQIPA